MIIISIFQRYMKSFFQVFLAVSLLFIQTGQASPTTKVQGVIQFIPTFKPASQGSVLEAVDILTIPADGTEVFSGMLENGVMYFLRVSGIFTWGGCDGLNCPGGGPDYIRWSDAVYISDNHFNSYSLSYFLYLTINGNRVGVVNYNPDHVYEAGFMGNGQKFSFKIIDCGWCYEDNSGNLRLEIFKYVNPPTSPIVLSVEPFQQRDIGLSSTDWGKDEYGEKNNNIPGPGYCGYTDRGSKNPPLPARIVDCGCYMTSWAMLIEYLGKAYNFHTSPHVLNYWLQENPGGYSGLDTNQYKILEYIRKKTPIGLVSYQQLSEQTAQSDQKLADLLSQGLPVILGVGQHYVLATGVTVALTGEKTFYINDPYNNNKVDLRPTLAKGYNNKYYSMEWVEIIPTQIAYNALSLTLASPAELLVTDPQGRRTGVDPRTNTTYNEIPNAYYREASIGDISSGVPPTTNGHPYKHFGLYPAVDGNYTVQVIGTDDGPYSLYVLRYQNDHPISYSTNGTIHLDEARSYTINPVSLTYLPIVRR